jgi:hypothetical protein
MDELSHLAASGVPEWIGLALTLLAIANKVAKNQRRSAYNQGQRIGALEQGLKEERTRRRQTEAVLCQLGVPLPFWPPDGQGQPRPRRLADEDLDEEPGPYPMTAEAARPPVPPFAADEASRLARHRR